MHKKLSLTQSTLMGVAGNAPAYGVGIATSTIVVSSAHAAPLAVVICGLAMVGILIAYQKLNADEPDCGAAYAWVGHVFHPAAGFLAGWSLLVALEFFMVSAMLVAGQTAADLLGLDHTANKPLVYALGLGILGLVTIPSLLGAGIFGRFQSVLTIIELSILAAIAFVALFQHGGAIVEALPDLLAKGSAFDLTAISKGVVIALFAFWGWDVVFNLSEETVETRRNSAAAALNTVVLLILIYVGFTTLAVLVLSEADMAGSSQNALLAIAHKVMPAPYGSLALIAFLISLIGSLDASIIQFSRTLLSGSRDGVFSTRLAHTSPRFGVPTFGIVVTVALAGMLTLLSYFSGTVNEIIAAGVAGSAILVAFYYGLAGFACAAFFLRNKPEGRIQFLLHVAWPAIASLVLVACAVFVALEFGLLTSAIVLAAFVAGLAVAWSQNGALRKRLPRTNT